VEFHIYGSGPEVEELEHLASDLGLSGTVCFKDPVSLTEVAAVIENADLGMVPKRTDGFGNEAFSTKILEFMTLGVPVVVSDSAVDRYYFTDQVVTFFKGNDDADLAYRLLEIIQNTPKREAQAKRADEFIKSFDWEVRKSDYLDLVDRLVQPAGVVAKTGANYSV
jgi:glycosyltransferase involved in cell wall biosynthesis